MLESLRRFVALHRFPWSQRPCFSSNGISIEWVLFTLQRRPLQRRVRRQGPPVSRRARGIWTATYVQKTPQLGAMLLVTQDGNNECARDKKPGLLVPYLLCSPAKELTQAFTNQTCLLRAKPACRKFAGLALRISQNCPTSSQRKPRYRLSPFLVLPASLEVCPRACILESRSKIISDAERPSAEGFM